MKEERMAPFLGWFSIGLGLAQVVAPGRLAEMIGIDDDGGTRTLMRAAGLREIASGLGILALPSPLAGLWARVAGDAMDLTLLARALTWSKARRDRVATATASIVGIAAVDVWCSGQLSSRPEAAGRASEDQAIVVKRSITIIRPPEEVYRFWHDFRNLPRFMSHLEAVQVTGDRRSHWKAKAPAGRTVEWDAEIVDDRPNELIAWRSLPGADVDNSGLVRFTPAPGNRGTEVRVELRYDPPGGALGATVAKIFGEEPEQQVHSDLHAFKQIMETGEITRSEATVRGQGPAQPPAERPAPPPRRMTA
jgi:uncharacterized membrane protein